MTNDERERIERMERNMEFIVEHQAKFSVDIDRINATLNKHSEAIVALTGWHGRLLEAQI